METHSSILSWEIPWTGEPIGLQFMGSQKVGHDLWTKQQQFSSVQLLSHVRLFVISWTAACQASLSITNSESSQTHVHRVRDAIHPSHPLSSPSPPALNLSQHHSPFQWVSSSHQVAKVLELELQLQHQSFQWILRVDFLCDGLVGPPCSPTDSQESSPMPQFKSINSLTLSFLYSPTLTAIHDHWKNHSFQSVKFYGYRLMPNII